MGEEDPDMNKSLRPVLALSALAVLGGCVAVPAGPAYYHEPAPVVLVPAPVYHGPTVHFDIRSRHGGHRGPGPRRGHR
jgi:hypothetical protein